MSQRQSSIITAKMTVSSSTPYNPSDNSAPFMELPEHVYGFIDLKTLADIHRYLSESESDEDILLANWVKENYLYEPIDQGGRTIRTTEGFSNLDRAYRRVRSLTNKAQDKWPFFDRNWKTMSSTTVRNNARGEAAPGVSLPGMEGESRTSPETNGLSTPQEGTISPVPQLQVPYAVKQSGRQQAQKKDFPRPSQQTPVPIPAAPRRQVQNGDKSGSVKTSASSKQQKPDEDQVQGELTSLNETNNPIDIIPKPENQAKISADAGENVAFESGITASKVPFSLANGTPISDQPKSDAGLGSESLQDGGGGKVRGPNGRYLPKGKSSPASVKARQASGGTRTNQFRADKAMLVEDNATTQEKPISSVYNEDDASNLKVRSSSLGASETGPGAFVQSSEVGTHAVKDDNIINDSGDLTVSAQTENDNSSGTIPSSYILAAEAEAVASNLDRLPPGLSRRSNKRKSEPIIQEDQRKRGRHGGIVGRPRKSEQLCINSIQPVDGISEKKTAPLRTNATTNSDVESITKMVTRRTARRSIAPNLDATMSEKPTDAQNVPKVQEYQSKNESETKENSDTIKVDMKDKIEGHVGSAPSSDASKPAPSAKSKVTLLAPSKQRKKPTTSTPNSQPQPTDSDLLSVGLSKTNPPSVKPGRKKRAKQMLNGTKTPHNSQAINGHLNAPIVNGFTNGATENTPGQIEYFARIHTFKGTVDVPIPTEKVESTESELIKKYAEWMAQEGGTDISFKHFCSILGFAKKG